eukprot:jgi/Botrbrau1/21191/Bobra.0415s0002.1
MGWIQCGGFFSGVTRLTRLQLLVEPQHELLLQCKSLRVLDLNGRLSDIQWLPLLPLLVGLSQLRELGQVPLNARAVVDGLAPLTQLVAVWCSKADSSHCSCLAGLAAISGLEAVALCASRDAGSTVEEFLLSSPQLQELILVDKCESQLAVALGSLSGLKKLEERYERGEAYALWCKVRDRLDLERFAPLPAPWALSATLEFLLVEVNEDQCLGLLRCITSLRQLTYLSIPVISPAVPGALVGPRGNGPWRRANFLKSLKQLKHLDLGFILQPANIAADVQCLVQLKQLSYLRLGTQPPLPYQKKLTAFESGGFLQLTQLEMLLKIAVSGQWSSLGGLPFTQKFNRMRHCLGLLVSTYLAMTRLEILEVSLEVLLVLR